MSDFKQDYFESTHSNVLSGEELMNCLRGIPALLFRIEIVKNKIEYLNNYQIDGLGDKTFLLLKNKQISKEIILEQDYYLYKSFIDSMHNAKNAITVIRIKNANNEVRWLKLIGSPNSYNPGYYLGMLIDITPSISVIEEMNVNEDERQTMLEMVDNPVILIDMSDKKIISHNIIAHELFGYNYEDFRRLMLNNLYHPSFNGEMTKIYEDIIFEKKWDGKILFKRKNQTHFLGRTVLRFLKIREKRLLRISIYEVDQTKNTTNLPLNKLSDSSQLYIDSLMNKIENVSDMNQLLETLLKNPYFDKQWDGLIYSDIQIKKNKVVVYACGDTFKNLKSSESFPYEGTIAENIEQYKLDHLIVDDTLSSIKAIDWALFTPYGIRSYYAIPYYERNALRSVLILCSKQTNAFSEEKIKYYNLLNQPFIKGLKNWRKANRNKKIA